MSSTPIIDVLVAYTPSAASASGDIVALIQLAVSETNQSYQNSGMSLRLRLAGTVQVNYTESGSFDTDLTRFRVTTDGYMDEIHSLRNTYGADVCVLILNNSQYCGLASRIEPVNDASTAFCAVHYDCATGYYSFGHEIGHLQGARHDRCVDASTTPYSYCHGYVYSSANWRTVMAYATCCASCTRIQYWSNPRITHNGVAMGTTQYEDNARVLDETAGTVAAFRSAFMASISGPSRLSVGQQGTWTVSASGGTGSYSYAWYFKSNDTGGQWWGPVTTGSSFTSHMYDYDGYLDIRVDVASGGQQISATKHVICTDCSGGPLTPQVAQDSLAIDSVSASITGDVIINQNYPNPFNPTTQIRFTLLKPNHVTLVVYDMLGREVARLADEHMAAGYHTVTWNASGKASGVYIYRLTAGTTVQVERMILMK